MKAKRAAATRGPDPVGAGAPKRRFGNVLHGSPKSAREDRRHRSVGVIRSELLDSFLSFGGCMAAARTLEPGSGTGSCPDFPSVGDRERKPAGRNCQSATIAIALRRLIPSVSFPIRGWKAGFGFGLIHSNRLATKIAENPRISSHEKWD